MTDDFEGRIRAARPVSGNRAMPLTDRAKRELAELLTSGSYTPKRSAPHARSRWPQRVLAGAAAAVIAAIAVVPTWQASPVHAATPQMLKPVAIDLPASDLLTTMSQHARAQATAPDPLQIRVQTWTLSIVDDGTDPSALPTVVAPQQYMITRAADGARTVEVRAVQPTDARGAPTTDPQAEAAPGELLWSQTDAAGEYPYLFTGRFPADASGVGEYLRQGIGPDVEPGGAEYFQAVTSLLLEQRPTGVHQAALLSFLARLPDVQTAGAVTDRLGREGIAFRAVRHGDPDYSEYLVVSPKTGQILAAETVYTGTSRRDINSPAVISYYAWNGS